MNNTIKPCRTCGKDDFENWGELSDHQLERIKIKDDPHKKDRAGTAWAKRYRHRNAINKMKKIGREFNPRTTLTVEQKQNKVDSRRELSEEVEKVDTYCPRCRKITPQLLPIEYTESPHAVRTQQGILEVICNNCRRR